MTTVNKDFRVKSGLVVEGLTTAGVVTTTSAGVVGSSASGYGDTYNPFASKTANYILAAPNGSSGAPSFRALLSADIPSLGNITNAGAIGSTSGLMVKTTTSGVLTTLAAGSAGQFLQYDGTWATPTGATYDISSVTTTGGALLRLTGSNSTTDDVKFASGTNSTVAYTDANTITISSTDTNYYPTSFAWTGGTTAGPTGSLTGSGMSAVSYAAIPSASVSASGIVTTGAQEFAGVKTLTSPSITTSLTTTSTTFALVNTTATTVNFAGAATSLNLGASTGTTTINNDAVITGNLTVNGTTTTINSTTITVDDKNLELGSVASPTNTTADGAGITVLGTTNKTWNWVNATSAWTSSENIDLASGKVIQIAGTTVISATGLGTGITSLPNVTSVNGTSIPSSKTLVVTTDIGTSVQAYDADLAAIAALTGTSGFLKTNGSGTWSVDTATYLTSSTGVTSVNGATGAITNVVKTTDKLSVHAATSSSELAGVISDETGTGALVFAGSPALTGTPTINAIAGLATATFTTTNTTAASSSAVFNTSAYTGAEVVIKAVNGTTMEIMKALLLVDSSGNVYVTEYADVPTGTQLIGTLDFTTTATSSTFDVAIRVTPFAGTSGTTTYKAALTLIAL